MYALHIAVCVSVCLSAAVSLFVFCTGVLQLRSQLASQLSALQADFDGVTIRLEEETEAAQTARAQLARLQNDYQVLKSKYDKEILALTEELEELR